MESEYKIRNEKIEMVVFDFIYGEALNDATNRVLKEGLKDEIAKVDCLKELVWNYANDVIENKKPDLYDYYDEIETQLQEKGIDYFTFGNVQKLINMTMKYLYIRYYDSEKAELFSCCHAPMDSIMRDWVYKKYKELTKGQKPGFSPETAWSKLNKNDHKNEKYKIENYEGFQNAIDYIIKKEGHNYNRIELDFRVWKSFKDKNN